MIVKIKENKNPPSLEKLSKCLDKVRNLIKEQNLVCYVSFNQGYQKFTRAPETL